MMKHRYYMITLCQAHSERIHAQSSILYHILRFPSYRIQFNGINL